MNAQSDAALTAMNCIGLSSERFNRPPHNNSCRGSMFELVVSK
jgi:hypothetical protein